MIDFTAAILPAVAGVIVSLLFEYFPALSEWYNGLVNGKQRLVMLGVMAVVTLAIVGFNCAGWFSEYVPVIACNSVGWQAAIVVFAEAAVANQTTYLLIPKKGDFAEG